MRTKFIYTGIRVKDLEASVQFYTRVLGMVVKDRTSFAETGGSVVDLVGPEGGSVLELNHYGDGSPFRTPYEESGEGLDHLAFKVQDLDAAIREATEAGHPVVEEVRTPTNRWVYIQDPNGIWIELSG